MPRLHKLKLGVIEHFPRAVCGEIRHFSDGRSGGTGDEGAGEVAGDGGDATVGCVAPASDLDGGASVGGRRREGGKEGEMGLKQYV